MLIDRPMMEIIGNLGNGDCRVDFVDVAIMMGYWLEEYGPLGTIDFQSIIL